MNIYVNPFNRTFELQVLMERIINEGKAYQYQLKFNELDLYNLANFDDKAIQEFFCYNTNSMVKFESTLKMPQHLTTIMGQQYQRVIKFLGWYSLHFDKKAPYIDHSTTPKSWSFENGVHPQRFYFQNWTYNEETRHFIGNVNFDESPYFGLSRYTYNLTFSEDFTEIIEGVRYGYNV